MVMNTGPEPEVTIAMKTSEEESTASVKLNVDDTLKFRHALEKLGTRYKFLRMIAEGGFGRIFLAEDTVLGREIVIKSLKEDHLPLPEDVQKFIAEAKLGAQLAHPSIVPLYSLNSDSTDGLHLSMQFINGITLKEHLKQCQEKLAHTPTTSKIYRREMQQRLEVFLKVCEAIDYSHSKGIAHCDLKPENIMLGEHGEVYVMDWGIACPIGTNRKGHLYGTPAYTAPETFQDGSTTPQTDVFALGMILHGIVSLRNPVSGGSVQETVSKIRMGDFEPPVPIDEKLHVSPALQAIIEKARAVDPADRYATAQELADDVRHYLFNEEVSALPDTPLQKLLRFTSRHRYATLLLLAAILCTCAMIAFYSEHRLRRVSAQINVETMRRIRSQKTTDQLASQIDHQLSDFRGKLHGLATGLSIANNSLLTSQELPEVYLLDSFAPNAPNPPQDLIPSPFYAEQISIENPSFQKPETMTMEQLRKEVFPLLETRSQALTMLWDGLTESKNFSLKELEHQYSEEEPLLRRITVLLFNGITMRYPGMHEAPSTQAELQGDWFRRKQLRMGEPYPWTPPYTDTSERSVVACWTALKDDQGVAYGQVGFELSFGKLVSSLMGYVEKDEFQSVCILVDYEGNVLFSTKVRNNYLAPQDMPLLAWLSRFRLSKIPQFLDRLSNDTLVRVTIAAIPQSNWSLIVLAPPALHDAADDQADEWERQSIEQDIRYEREFLSR